MADKVSSFAAAIDDPMRFKHSRDVGPYLGLVPKRHQSGEVDYIGSISKRGDVRVRTLLYEAANVMLTRYAAQIMGTRHWATLDNAKSAGGARKTACDHPACHDARSD